MMAIMRRAIGMAGRGVPTLVGPGCSGVALMNSIRRR
jgi:hypothetical protein